MATGRTRLVRPADQAAGFGRTRDAHRAEIAEDYCELIADLIDATGEARAVELASRLGVTAATVNNTITRLQREGLVRSEPYRAIFLTEFRPRPRRGLPPPTPDRDRVPARPGVGEATALRDAEGIEHHVSEETLAALERATGRLRGGTADR